ncbi:MAG: hypothetical protein GPOALKHO_001537 [Sodalis sp.]|nr:MAG: hypothetical protein GPOALKHO_001537 [Sodalis sp.]
MYLLGHGGIAEGVFTRDFLKCFTGWNVDKDDGKVSCTDSCSKASGGSVAPVLQGKHAEHRQRRQDKQHGKPNRQCRLLQRRLKLQVSGRHCYAQQGNGHPHNVDHRQQRTRLPRTTAEIKGYIGSTNGVKAIPKNGTLSLWSRVLWGIIIPWPIAGAFASAGAVKPIVMTLWAGSVKALRVAFTSSRQIC